MSNFSIYTLHIDDLAEPWSSYGRKFNTDDGFVWVVFYGDRIYGVFPSLAMAEEFRAGLQLHLDNAMQLPKQTPGHAKSIEFKLKKEREKNDLKKHGSTPLDPPAGP